MSNLIQNALLICRSPLTQFQRFRVKINIQRPRKTHYERARVVAVTTPKFEEPPKTLTCFQPKRYQLNKVENPYNDIIAREVRNWFDHSALVCIFHTNSIISDDIFRARVALYKQNMYLKTYGKKIMIKALTDSPYESLLPLFDSSFHIVFSTEQRVSEMLRIFKKIPQMILLGGVIENRLLSRKEIIAFAQLPGLQAVQVELVQTLNMAAGNLVRQLETHQNDFVNILDVYAKDNNTDEKDEEKATVKIIEKSADDEVGKTT